jgi:choline kinase
LNRSTTSIKKNITEKGLSVVIISAGAGARIRSNEPRSLIKIKNDYLINHQVNNIYTSFKKVEVIGVFGVFIEKIIKKLNRKVRVVENQLHETTNSSESMRLGLNNCLYDSVLFIHGDIFFDEELIKNADYSKSFLILDVNNDMDEKEVGVTINKKNVTVLSYGLSKKWCQICFLTGKELKIAKNIFSKFEKVDKKMLSFEILNKIIESGGSFGYYENSNSHVVEIDCIKDLDNENFNL